MGVTSLIDLMSRPLVARARIADSRPAPGPLTLTSHRADAMLLRHLGGVQGRHLRGERGALAGALEADAAGARPRQDVSGRVGDGHDGVVEGGRDGRDSVGNVLPFLALGAGATRARLWCSCSSHSFSSKLSALSSQARHPRGAASCELPAASLFLRCFLLAGDRALAGSLASTRIGVRTLAADGETTTVAHATVAVDLHEPLDVEADVLAQVALDLALVGDDLADLADVVFRSDP